MSEDRNSLSHVDDKLFDGEGEDDDMEDFPIPWDLRAVALFDGGIGMLLMTLGTIYALYGDDIRLATTDKSADTVFFALSCVCLFMFCLEFLVFCIAKRKYLWGFFFWLDMVAFLSIIPDVPWMWDPLYEAFGGEVTSEGQDLGVARAGRASRAGTKAGRLVRFLRIIRLVRVVKLYKYCGKQTTTDEEEMEEEELEVFSNDLGSSRVGSDWSEFMMRKVIIGVLGLLFVIPFLTVDIDDTGPQVLLSHFNAYFPVANPSVTATYYNERLSAFQTKYSSTLLYFVSNGTVKSNLTEAINSLRDDEINKISVNNGTYVAWLNQKQLSQRKAESNMLLTTFILLLLGLGTMQFSNDANESVIYPIERMVAFVRALADDPLGKITLPASKKHHNAQFETSLLEATLLKLAGLLQVGFGTAGAEIMSKNIGKAGTIEPMVPGQKMYAVFGFCDIRSFGTCTEALQEQTLVMVNQVAEIVHEICAKFNGHANKNIGNAFLLLWKFGPLPGIKPVKKNRKASSIGTPMGYNRRGSNFGSTMMASGGDSTITVGPDGTIERKVLTPLGTKGVAKAQTLTSPNGQLAAPGGQSLQNPWLSSPGGGKEKPGSSEVSLQQMLQDPGTFEVMSERAEEALLGFCYVIDQVLTNAELARWRTDLRLLNKGWGLSMGFGLHIGWAIEGAIGSKLKIDASYLSPNVNMASRLEAASKQYGVHLLMSGDFFCLLQAEIQSCCRHLDRITVKGSLQPIDIYTIDLNPKAVNRRGSTMSVVNDVQNGKRFQFNLANMVTVERVLDEEERNKKSKKTNFAEKLGAVSTAFKDKLAKKLARPPPTRQMSVVAAKAAKAALLKQQKQQEANALTAPASVEEQKVGGGAKRASLFQRSNRVAPAPLDVKHELLSTKTFTITAIDADAEDPLPPPPALPKASTTFASPVSHKKLKTLSRTSSHVARDSKSSAPLAVKSMEREENARYRVKQVMALQIGIDKSFVSTFNKACELYIKGEWKPAKTLLMNCQKLAPRDKPTQILMDFMGETHFTAPPDWPGYRALTSK